MNKHLRKQQLACEPVVSRRNTFQAQETARAKALRQEYTGMLEEQQGGQCGWNTC